ncbi:glycosyltransferase [Sphingomonas sp. LB-2]|uniref:glycosyltransferase n=1 Tax=Sphingomonas caeni TaxID=2984949 RepID=UPI00223082B2|nr:glycosyltransferase [Sphingomonas caeni]MCW3846379.1 glycosyltransferase [Sphingomonas caeni]
MAFAQTLKGGGVERALMRLSRGWIGAGRRVTLVIGNTEGPLAQELPEGVTVRHLHNGDYGSLVREVPAAVRDTSPDLIFCPGNHYTSVAGYCRVRLGRDCPPIVGKVSNALVRPDHHPALAWGYRRWLGAHRWFLDHVVAMTRAMAAEAMREMGFARDRVSVIANPLATSMPGAVPIALPQGRFVLGVGRLEAQKRWDRLIAAMPLLDDSEARLLILGEGRLHGMLEAQAAQLGISERVWLPGHAADPLPAVQKAAVLALTSEFEGVPGVIREALALGTPVVSTDSSVAVRELIEVPAQGDVVARGDQAALVAALNRWLAPGAVRPQPTGDNGGGDPVTDYLDLFDRVTAQRRAA